MTPDTIFAQAIAIDSAEQRAAFLDDSCRHDPDMRREVEGLVRDHFRAGQFLERPAGCIAVTADESVGERPGTVIGPYKLMEQIGEGGFGLVFVAEQQHPVRRKVALKVIKPGMDSRQVVARFEAERQALALMDHANIARVFDAGATTSGRPYFVMELVKGVPITTFCDAHRLTTRDRLGLFVSVCSAVQHAHQKGVIHRDLKPSNVLVTIDDSTSAVKVIDFGVAKAIGQQLTEKTVYTQFTQMVGTPLYMSPEQAGQSGLDVDTRTDIYALGVLLYELLTGTTPFNEERLRAVGFDEMRRIIRDEEPAKPSTRISTLGQAAVTVSVNRQTDPKRLSRLCRGELDWIVMKALEKDRDRRYESASAFAADVEHYLRDEPVHACPPSLGYRLRKFVRRHKGAVLAAAIVMLTLVGGIVGTTFGLVRAEQRAEGEREARQAAQEREAETTAVLDFVEQKVFTAARPEGWGGLGHDVTLRQAIAVALSFVDQSFADQPLIEARLRMSLGWSFACLGEIRIAAEQLEAARRLYTRFRGADDPETLRTMSGLALLYGDLGRLPEALKLHEETLALQRMKLGPTHRDTLTTMSHVAFGNSNANRDDEAIRLGNEVLALQTQTLGPDHEDTLISMMWMTRAYSMAGRYAEALKLSDQTLERQRANLPPNHAFILRSMLIRSGIYSGLGRQADALRLREEVLPLMQARLGPDNPVTLMAMSFLAESYAGAGRQSEALNLREETLAKTKLKLGPDNPETLGRTADLVESLIACGRGAEAVPLIDEYLGREEGKNFPPGTLSRARLIELRLRYFEKNKDVAGCRATAEMWERLNRTDANSLYNAGCFRAVTAAAAKVDPTIPARDAARLAQEQADLAMAWLHKAVAAGFMNAEHVKKDTDVDSLRGREDFKDLMAVLQAKKK